MADFPDVNLNALPNRNHNGGHSRPSIRHEPKCERSLRVFLCQPFSKPV